MVRLSAGEERMVWPAVSIVLFLFLGGPALRSPDGMEMLRLSASWLGSTTDVGDPSFWPPLWSALNVPSVALGYGTAGARLINLVCWGAIAWPLHALASQLLDRSAGRIAVILYVLIPAFLDHAGVLDARPVGALITTWFVAASVAAVTNRKGVASVLVLASLAPLARPEGILLPVMAGVVVWLSGHRWWKSVLMAMGSLLPYGVFRSSFRGLSGHEQLFGPWYGTWSTWDLLSLFGPASVPTEFRRFALAAVESGVVPGDPAIEEFVGVIMAMPAGFVGSAGILVGAVGVTGLLAVLRGAMVPESRVARWTVVGLVGLPLAAVAVAPMAKDQAGALSNYLFVLPGLLALIAVGIASLRHRNAMVLCVGLVVAEVHLTPLSHEPPYFLEGSEAAALAAQMLVSNPPSTKVVGADFSSRDVVLRAGLNVRPLGPIWAGAIPADVEAVMINSVGAKGEDGGRTLALLESPDWSVQWVVGDGDLAISRGEVPKMPRPERGWYALLQRR